MWIGKVKRVESEMMMDMRRGKTSKEFCKVLERLAKCSILIDREAAERRLTPLGYLMPAFGEVVTAWGTTSTAEKNAKPQAANRATHSLMFYVSVPVACQLV